jgi:hypothetical protein
MVADPAIRIAKLRQALSGGHDFSGIVSVFPVAGRAGIAKDEVDQIGETRIRTRIVGQDQNTALTSLDADHGVGGPAIVTTLIEAVALRAVEYNAALMRGDGLTLF